MIREPVVTAGALISTEDTLQKLFKGGVQSRVTHMFRVAELGCQAAKPGMDAGNLSDNAPGSFVCLLCLRCIVGFEK
jgi:hypothetical protein